MLLHTIAHYLTEESKTSNGSKQLHFSAPSEELVYIDETMLPYIVRLVGHANQVVIIEKAQAADEKRLVSGTTIVYKTPAINFEDMKDLHKALELILKAAKVTEHLTDAATVLIHWPIVVAEDLKRESEVLTQLEAKEYVERNLQQVTEDQGQMHDTAEP